MSYMEYSFPLFGKEYFLYGAEENMHLTTS